MPPATAQTMPAPVKEKDVPREVQPSATSPDSQMVSSQNDPNSISNLMKQTEVMNGQATANSLYDPPVPPPSTDGFVNFIQSGLLSRLLIVLLLLGVGVLIFYMCCDKGQLQRASFPTFKMPRIFRK
jgi:hypothetical protein